MCLLSRRINHTRGSHPPKTDMLVRYTMYFEHLNIMFFQKKNFAVKIMIILRIYDINIIIMMMMRGLADPTRTIYYHYQYHHHHRHYYYYIIIATIVI